MRALARGPVVAGALLGVCGGVGGMMEAGWATPVDRQKKLPSAVALAQIHSGESVAASGDTVIVGAPSDVLPLGGFAAIHERDEGGADAWGLVTSISSSDLGVGDRFGAAVAIDGDVAVVGAPWNDDAGSSSGSAYVFVRDSGGPDNWGEVKKLVASDAAAFDQFGQAVAVYGDTIVVGANGDDPGGSAYVFQKDAGGLDNWGEVAKLEASDAATGDNFGWSVAVHGDTALIGAFGADHVAVGAGAAYVFERDEGGPDAWGEVTKISASDAATGDNFGDAVALSGDVALVGAPLAGPSDAGQAYLFERDQGGPSAWGESKVLDASGPGSEPFFAGSFGGAVAIDGDSALVGAGADDDRAPSAGAAYLFARDQGGADNWGEVRKISAGDAMEGDGFGGSVAIAGSVVIAGARGVDAGAALDAGAAYVFQETTVCESGPSACVEAWGKGTLLIRESKPGKEKLVARFLQGPALEQTDLGSPLDADGTAFTACLFDDAGVLLAKMTADRAAGSCAGKACWKPSGGEPPSGHGYLYRDKNVSADGLSRLKLRGGDAGKARFQIQAKNNAQKGQPRMPTGLAAALAGSASARLELHGDDLSSCFALTYGDVQVSSTDLFKAAK